MEVTTEYLFKIIGILQVKLMVQEEAVYRQREKEKNEKEKVANEETK